MPGTLYLIPTTLGGDDIDQVIPPYVAGITRQLSIFVVEDLRTARRYLSRLQLNRPIDSLTFHSLNEHSTQSELEGCLRPLLGGLSVGLLSEAGTPAVADPGAELVMAAHRHGVRVVPLSGPSSILLALMASGLNGQNFAFVGYLPVKPPDRAKRLRQLENRSREEGQSQLFIEAPYRNNQLMETLLSTLSPRTVLTVACDLTLPTEFIASREIAMWADRPNLHKRPCIFGIQA